MYTFMCHACGRRSRFSDQHTEILIEMLTMEVNRKRTRTYRCQFCHSDNEIDHTDAEWFIIDADLDKTGRDSHAARPGGVSRDW
jgi:hypothetical protein